MGKKEKEHRKKVQARNIKLVAARKRFEKEMGEEFRKQMAEVKSASAPSQKQTYASTGDFIAKNYEFIQGDQNKQRVAEFLEENSGVSFSS